MPVTRCADLCLVSLSVIDNQAVSSYLQDCRLTKNASGVSKKIGGDHGKIYKDCTFGSDNNATFVSFNGEGKVNAKTLETLETMSPAAMVFIGTCSEVNEFCCSVGDVIVTNNVRVFAQPDPPHYTQLTCANTNKLVSCSAEGSGVYGPDDTNINVINDMKLGINYHPHLRNSDHSTVVATIDANALPYIKFAVDNDVSWFCIFTVGKFTENQKNSIHDLRQQKLHVRSSIAILDRLINGITLVMDKRAHLHEVISKLKQKNGNEPITIT